MDVKLISKFDGMRKLIWIGVVLLLIVACQQGPDRWTNQSPEIDAVKSLISDYNAGNWDAWKGHYADTAKLYHNSTEPADIAQTLEGLQGYLEPISEYGFSDKDVFYEMIIDDKNEKWVNFWGTWEGKVGALDRDLKIPVHLTAQFMDGKIVEEHAYYNLVDYMMAVNEIAAMNDDSSGDVE